MEPFGWTDKYSVRAQIAIGLGFVAVALLVVAMLLLNIGKGTGPQMAPFIVMLLGFGGFVLWRASRRVEDEKPAAAKAAAHSDPVLRVALQLGDRGDWAGAIRQLDSVIAMRPDHAEALAQRGFAYAELGETDRAMADWEEALTLTRDPDIIGGIRQATELLRETGV